MIPAPMTDSLPVALYNATQVRELDARLIAAGTSGFELMQRAAHAAWRALRRRWPDAGAVTVLAGRGNNAGDGYLLAALAQRAGWQVRVLAVGDPQTLQGDAALACAEARDCGVPIEPWRAEAPLQGVLVDALLGTGLTGAVREPYASAIAAINAPFETFDGDNRARLEALPKDTALAFLCHHGGRSAQAAEQFRALGFTKVSNITGGIDAWSNEVDNGVPKY